MTNRPEASEAGLIEAAGALFREKGYAATTVRDIAAAAGILPGSLHYRFPTKESLLIALMERGITTAIDAVSQSIASSHGPRHRIEAAIAAHLKLLLRDDDAVYVLLYEHRALCGAAREEVVRLRDRYDALWDGLLYSALGACMVRPVDLKLARLFLLGALNWSAQWYTPVGLYTCDQVAKQFADMFFNGLSLGTTEFAS